MEQKGEKKVEFFGKKITSLDDVKKYTKKTEEISELRKGDLTEPSTLDKFIEDYSKGAPKDAYVPSPDEIYNMPTPKIKRILDTLSMYYVKGIQNYLSTEKGQTELFSELKGSKLEQALMSIPPVDNSEIAEKHKNLIEALSVAQTKKPEVIEQFVKNYYAKRFEETKDIYYLLSLQMLTSEQLAKGLGTIIQHLKSEFLSYFTKEEIIEKEGKKLKARVLDEGKAKEYIRKLLGGLKEEEKRMVLYNFARLITQKDETEEGALKVA